MNYQLYMYYNEFQNVIIKLIVTITKFFNLFGSMRAYLLRN